MSVPGKLTSYLAIGRPIIVSASPDSETARIVQEAGAGVIVPPADGAAIGRALSELAASPQQVETFTAGATRYAAAHLDRKVGLDRFVEWALALAERRAPRFDEDIEEAAGPAHA
jgi:glycosyltransferase involved in cell wall biosynthesis